jgi:beta,beta-carotene 9',10'-dioxygenase
MPLVGTMFYAVTTLFLLLAAVFIYRKVHKQLKSPLNIHLDLEQELSSQSLPVKGEFPEWLSGNLIRNGPVMFSISGKPIGHWFDGLGMLHAFAFAKGQVHYSNRFLRSNAHQKVFENGSMDYLTFASDPCRSLYQRFIAIYTPSMGEPIKNANVNITKMADQWVALTEIPLPVRFDKNTLETVGVLDFSDDLPKSRCFESAHPHHDPFRKETISYLVKYGRASSYIIYRLPDGSARREPIASIPVDEPSYMHSFAVTENYVILTEFPFVVNPLGLLLQGKPFIKNFKWKPEKKTRFLMVERRSGALVGRFTSEAFFAFHHVNAYEKGDEIIMDLVVYPDPGIITLLGPYPSLENDPIGAKKFNENIRASLKRFCLSLTSGTVKSAHLFDGPLEFPRINETRCHGKAYQYLYGVDPRVVGALSVKGTLYKIDVNSYQVTTWSEGDCQPGEPVFVPSPSSSAEDEGVVLSVVFDLAKRHSFLIALDARTFQEIARAEVPHKIPLGLHGQFFSNKNHCLL